MTTGDSSDCHPETGGRLLSRSDPAIGAGQPNVESTFGRAPWPRRAGVSTGVHSTGSLEWGLVIVLQAFGAVVGVSGFSTAIEDRLVERLVGETPLVLGSGDPDATVEVRQSPDFLVSDCRVGSELIRRHVAYSEPDIIAAVVGSIHHAVATCSRGFTFVHAGCVAFGDTAVVLPGRSHTGKSTLVEALLASGASYLSDEYLVLTPAGEALPYIKPVSRRSDDGRTALVSVEELGATEAKDRVFTERASTALTVFTTYRPGADFEPKPMSEGEVTLGLITNSVNVRSSPETGVPAVSAFGGWSRGLSGDRGQAQPAAEMLRDLANRYQRN